MADQSAARLVAGEDEARRIFELQHQASRQGPAADVELRRDRLERLRAVVAGNEAAFAKAISDDFGVRSRTETELLEIVPTLNAIRHARRNRGALDAARAAPGRSAVPAGQRPGAPRAARRDRDHLALELPAPARLLAAGRRARRRQPGDGQAVRADAGFLRAAPARWSRSGSTRPRWRWSPAESRSARPSPALPFDHLLFTGSTAIGRKVYQAAAANLVPVTLELGGKSPAIVCPDYDLAKAARSIAFGKFVNAGQTCIAPDYVLVPEGKERAFAEAVMAQVRRSYPDHRRQ